MIKMEGLRDLIGCFYVSGAGR